MIFRVDLNAEHTTGIINWMFESFAGVAGQKTSQRLSPEFLEQKNIFQVLFNRFERSNLGPAGTMISQDGYFEHALPIGISVPPMIGTTSFYKFRVYQLQVNLKINIEGLMLLKDRVVRACRIAVKGP